jgi:L-seryl-tRNA(Ser) seleniumtransferase
MVAAPVAMLRARANSVVSAVGDDRVDVVEVASTVGGGSLPGETLPSVGLAFDVRSPDRLLERLRVGEPAVIGRIEKDRLILDLRTVAPEDDEALAGAVRAALAPRP